MFKLPQVHDKTKSINWNNNTECKALDIPVFNPEHPDTVDFTDVVQGTVGSCWFLTAIISYLRPNDKNIEARKNDIHKCIKLYSEDNYRKVYTVILNGKKIFVDNYVPVNHYTNTQKIKCIWYILYEKAMISLMTIKHHFKNSNNVIQDNKILVKDLNIESGEMNSASFAFNFFLPGYNHKAYCLHKQDRQNGRLKHTNSLDMYKNFKDGHHLVANTARNVYPNKTYNQTGRMTDFGALPTHCYAIIDMKYDKNLETYMLTIYNPWGCAEIPEKNNEYIIPKGYSKGQGVFMISWERFWFLFACVHMSK